MKSSKIKPFDKILPFCNMNYTVAILDGKVGLIDLKGNPLTEFIYDDLTEYYKEYEDGIGCWILLNEQDCCSLRLNGKWGLIDKTGKIVIDFKYNNEILVRQECDNLYFVRLNSFLYIYNKDWERINEISYKRLHFLNNHIIFRNEKYGVMDLNGNIVIEPIYNYISTHFNTATGFWICEKDDKYGIIDLKGNVVIDFKYKNLSVSRSEKYISAIRYEDERCGIIDFNNNVIIDFLYDKIEFCDTEDLKEEYFLIEENNHSLLFNTQGKRII